MARAIALALAGASVCMPLAAEELPIKISGELRARIEGLDGQFRRGGNGSDQLLLFRTLILGEYDPGPVAVVAEFQDSRTYFGDKGTPLSTSITNPADILQLHLRFDDLPGLVGQGSSSQLQLGRQTVNIGSRRQIERVDFANAIFSYTGAHLTSSSPRGDRLHLLYVVPTARFPNDADGLLDNDISGDEEQWQRRIWAVHAIRADIAPQLISELSAELFVYGFDEQDTASFPTADRSHVAPGFRLYRPPKAGRADLDLEAALRRGTRYASSAPGPARRLRVDASMLFVAAGYTFETAWSPRLALEYYYASGDDDPLDDEFNQHERLFGSRRTDLNNTSIHGPLTPANLSAPGLRLEIRPDRRTDGWLKYQAVSLASATDSWVVARLRDPTGRSGKFIGHAVDGRVRHWIVPGSWRLEVGGSLLEFGEFPKRVPGGPAAQRTIYGYTQISYVF